MGRILAIDYGLKRTGLAVTDPLKIISSPLETVPTVGIFSWLKIYIEKEEVERIVVGMPVNLNKTDTDATEPVKSFIKKLKTTFPLISVSTEDERFTSKIARQTMIMGGMKKKDRRIKGNVDKISASIILQSYLEKANH
ncbi:MAG: Holliday junction resolvase RuvX [Cyclobacteriaceae bacterium]|nr:Holliday junction resolvase RuvX [Cyclobacteriaceae bacterium]MCK5700901.1 Holliday junction resolvase RuvX [Cyclobacteriaceae bacterium]